MNPRAAINDLLPFQGSPFGQLGYFSKAERVGFEPTRPFGQTVFKTASFMTTSIPLQVRCHDYLFFMRRGLFYHISKNRVKTSF